MEINADSPAADTQRAAFARRIRDEAAVAGAPAGLAYAEAFRRIDDL